VELGEKFQLPTPPIFSFQECRWFLDRNYDDIMHRVTDHSVIKPFRAGGQVALLEIVEDGKQLSVIARGGGPAHEGALREQVAALFDLEKDLLPFYELLRADPDLAFMATDYWGLRLIGIPDLFEALCWSIIGQQINLSFAYSLKRRLVELAGEEIEYDNHLYYGFPTPSQVAALSVEQLRALQFSGRKAEYLIGLAHTFAAGGMSQEYLLSLHSAEAQVLALTSLRGIGEWTAHYALMKSLKVPSALPYGDVGLYNALFKIKNLPRKPSRAELNAVFEPFRGWEAYLTLYLWRTLAVWSEKR
jgi:DNA-3-methyladenine glycosylase II